VSEGTQVRSPAVPVTEEMVATLVRTGGYTHPLFAGADAPLMGQGALLLAGGLAEQSGVLDRAIALVGLENVRFRAMARPGASVSLLMELLDSTPTSHGRHLERYSWTMVDESETVVLDAVALMLTHPREGSTAP
jgi:3-hydroxymyristoyl/3-hydroxydecanoyl-(acyl carrier protein) dehydratase